MAETWPLSTVVAQRRDHKHIKDNAISSTQFAAGNKRRRQNISEAIETFELSFVMTETQLNTFIAFWKAAGAGGAADIDGLKVKDHNGVITSGSNGAPSMRIKTVFQPERIGVETWKVTAQAERVTDNIESLESYMDGAYINWENGDRMLWENSDYIVWD